MTPADKETLLAEIIEMSRPRTRGPNDITIGDYAEAAGVSHSTAKTDLNRLVEQGKLQAAWAFDLEKRRRVRVWFRA